MPDISAILKNKGISLADTNESKILSSLNGLFQRPVEPIHFSKLVLVGNQFDDRGNRNRSRRVY